jgi:hypothetical protein
MCNVTRVVPGLLLLALLCGQYACGDGDGKPADEAKDAGPSDTGAAPDTGGPADAGGGDVEADGDAGRPPLDLSVPLGPGEVRAGVITREEELIGGALPKGRVGDFKIYNSKIRVVIEGARPSDGWLVYGGGIADADIAREPGAPGGSLFGDYAFGFGLMLMDAQTVEVVADGSDGKPAVIRAKGPDRPLPFLDKTPIGQVLEPTPLNTEITVDYVLAPDSDILEIQTSFVFRGRTATELTNVLHAFFMGDGLRYWLPGKGFDLETMTGGWPYYVMAGRDVSYAFLGEDGEMSVLLKYEGMVFSTSPDLRVVPKESVTLKRYLAVGGGGVDSVLRAYNRWNNTEGLGLISGHVTEPDGVTPAPGARVHVLADGAPAGARYVSQAVAGGDGAYSVEVPAGDYVLVPFVDGRASAVEEMATVVASGEQAVDLKLAGFGTVEFETKDDAGAVMPAKLTFIRQEGKLTPLAGFGEMDWGGSRQWVVYSTGAGAVSLPAGTYSVTFSRGFEYELDEQTFTLADGQTATISGMLLKSVDTTGYVSSDFHLHALASPDSDVPFVDRVASLAAEGVEAPIATEHDFIKDWMPAAEALGLTDWVHPIVGSEITTYVYGHFNAWPLDPAPAEQNDGAFVWYEKMAPELFAEVAAYPTNPILQVNHARTASIGGYFSAALYDRATGTAGKPENWSTQFTSVEIINGGDIGTAQKETLPDMYSFWNRGLRIAASSGSDVHDIRGNVGEVRNWITSSTDSPDGIEPFALRDSVRVLRLLVSTGPFVSVSIAGAGMGDDVTVTGGQVDLAIKVQAPSWMDVKTLSVVGNGVEVASAAIDSGTADPQNPAIRYKDTVTLAPAADTWYIVLVSGDRNRDPVQGARSFAVTNPIFVDVDGNGAFDPPVK